MRKALLVLAFAALTIAAAPSERREVGNLVFDGVPELPAELRERVAPYYNARSAVFEDWLPDGSMLIATRFGDVNQIHRVAAPGAARTQLTFFSEPVNSAKVMPGSNRFLYPRDVGGAEYYQAFLRDLGGQEAQLTKPGTRNSGFVFSKDGKLVVWSQVTPGDGDYDIVAADPNRPADRRVVLEGTGAISPLDISPDGKSVLLGRYVSASESHLSILDLQSGAVRPVGEWPDKRKIAYAGGAFTADGQGIVTLSDIHSDTARPVVLPIDGYKHRDLAPPDNAILIKSPARCELEARKAKSPVFSPSCPPTLRQVWGAEAFVISPDRSVIAVAINEDGYSRIDMIEIATGKALPAPKLPKGVISGLGFSPDGKRLGVSLSTSRASGDVWAWDRQTGDLVRWTTSELGGLSESKMVEPALIHYRSFDARPIPAFIYKPQDHSEGGKTGKLPVIIQIHGGPEAQELPGFSARRQSWVNELGAAVIVPNVRGSTGYGGVYQKLDNGPLREDSVKDIGALLDWIAAQPDLDSTRVAVVGQSYGGYMALAVAGRYNDRIAGAIDLYGISNWITFLENTEGYRRDLRRAEYGDERDPKMRAVFEQISPTAYVSAMKKPMMIYQGANDPRVPRSESEAIVARLRQQGTEVWYVLAKDEGHGIARRGNQEAVRGVEILFLRKVLGIE